MIYLKYITGLDEVVATLETAVNEQKQNIVYIQAMHFITLCSHEISKIQEQIKAEFHQQKRNGDNYNQKKDELLKKGFNESEVEKIIGAKPYQNDRDFYLKVIEPLESKQATLEALLASMDENFPYADQSLLIGTEYEKWLLSKENWLVQEAIAA